MTHSTRHDRRRFLQGMTALLATGTAGALFPQLELMGRALAAAPAPGEYRALAAAAGAGVAGLRDPALIFIPRHGRRCGPPGASDVAFHPP